MNCKLLVENTNFLDFEDGTFVQKIALNKGDNILLIKIIGMDNYEWGRNYSICIGDVYGAPIKEISLKPVHK